MFLGGSWVGRLVCRTRTGLSRCMADFVQYDNYGPRWLLLIGSFLHVFGLMMASISTEYYQFLLSQGVCSPIGASMVFYPSFSVVVTWFFRKRAMAVGLAASGSSLGGVIFPVMVSKLIREVGFPWTMRICAFLMLGLLTVTNLLVKSRIPPFPKPVKLMDFINPLKEPPFALLTLVSPSIFSSVANSANHVTGNVLVLLRFVKVLGQFGIPTDQISGLFLPFTFIILAAIEKGMGSVLATYLVSILNATRSATDHTPLFSKIQPANE